MKSHRRSRTWHTMACSCAGVPASMMPSRKFVSTASTRYTLRYSKVGAQVRRGTRAAACGQGHRHRRTLGSP